jgi:hypothetical protein
VEVNDEGYPEHGRIAVFKPFTQETVNATVQGIAAPGARFLTDGLGTFGGLEAAGFHYSPTRTKDLPDGVEPFAHMHILVSNGKAWLQGTFHGLGPKYMQPYLSEFCYRFNRRRLEHRPVDHLLTACTAAPHVPLAAIKAG